MLRLRGNSFDVPSDNAAIGDIALCGVVHLLAAVVVHMTKLESVKCVLCGRQ